jgi:hypothetical protein
VLLRRIFSGGACFFVELPLPARCMFGSSAPCANFVTIAMVTVTTPLALQNFPALLGRRNHKDCSKVSKQEAQREPHIPHSVGNHLGQPILVNANSSFRVAHDHSQRNAVG